MSEPFMGQIELFSFDYAPKNWAFCRGQTLPIQQYQALFTLLGTTYGGDGVQSFKLPDLQGRIPVGFSQTHPQGQSAGEEQHALTTGEIPSHIHALLGDATGAGAISGVPGPTMALSVTSGKGQNGSFNVLMYGTSPDAALDPRTVTGAGGASHENRAPYLSLNPCIALFGIYPSRQ